jgi:tyrosine-protein kinase
LLLGIALAVVLELIDRSVRNPKEAETIFDRPILGTIPRSAALSGNNGLHLPAPDKESFRMLQANLLYFNGEKPVRSVLVTSAASGDGKSTVAWNVAAAGAEAGGKVLLMEADLRHPGFASRCGLKVDAGLSDVLLGHCELDDVVRETLIGEPGGLSTNGYVNGNGHSNGNGNGNGRRLTATMDVVFAGRTPSSPGALIASGRMSSLIREAEAIYDLVVIDTPPVTVVSDAIPLVNQVTGVIVVARLGKNTREATSRLRDHLRNLNASVLGVVVNSIDSPDPYYRSLSHYVQAGAGVES